MFYSVKRKLPAADYVSIVASLFSEKLSLIVGAAVSAAAAWATYMHTGAPILAVIASLFLLGGAARHILILWFEKADLQPDDVVGAGFWEGCMTIATVGTALIYGAWCYISLVFITDPFAQLSSIMVSIAVLIGLVTRTFAIDRIVSLSSIAIALPLAAGLLTMNNVYYAVMGVLLLPYLFSIRSLAGNIRNLLLTAVHGRQDASRLAAELDTALTTMPHGLCMLDENGCVAVINKQTRFSFLGEAPEQFIGRPFTEVIAGARDAGTVTAATAEYIISEIAAGGHSKLVVGLVGGQQCEITINTRLGRTVLMMEDITERVTAAERINYMARYDGLTQLSNRSFFSEQAEARLKEQHAVDSAETVMMMIVDIDDFKHVNDTFGHPVGDALLIEVAGRLATIFGEDAMISRFGGDEFMVFRAGGASEALARADAEAVLAALHVPARVRDENLIINASVGVALAQGAHVELDSLLTQADLALYKAKGNGKAQYRLFHEQMDVEYRQRQRMKADLRNALGNDELYLLFQPIVDMETRKVRGCEALVRWRHNELGLIPPMQFIPIAEEIGVMSEITAWVLENAALECMNWPEDVTISVNLSATDFRDADVEGMIDNALKISGLPPERLTVEITETTIIEELDGAVKALTAVRRKGVDVALDDFGTGYSSLSYLHTLPFTKLKIDRSFVVDVTTSERSQRLLSNIARLSKDLDLTVTVEGIETEEQLQVIARTARVDFAQGYLFGAPLPRRDVAELIERVSPPTRPLLQKKA